MDYSDGNLAFGRQLYRLIMIRTRSVSDSFWIRLLENLDECYRPIGDFLRELEFAIEFFNLTYTSWGGGKFACTNKDLNR